jgi:tetratricopeptide (TPR) repeat protein
MMKRLGLLFCVILCFTTARAQEPAGAAWLVARFDITANLNQDARALNAQATLTVRNVGRGSGASLTARINNKAEVKAVSAGGAAIPFRVTDEARGNLKAIRATLPGAVAPGGTAEVVYDYALPVAKNEGTAAISLSGGQFLPVASWYPAPNTIYAPRGADAAPWRVTLNAGGATLVAPGKLTANGAEVASYGQPFFVAGAWDKIDAAGGSAFVFKGSDAAARTRAQELLELANAARAFYAGLLGPAPDAPFRLVQVQSGGGFSGGGALLLNPAAFRCAKLDANTALLVSEAVAQLWTDGPAPLRGEGVGALRNGLTHYLALLFLEKQFGPDAADAEWQRARAAHRRVAANEAPIALTTPLDGAYYTSTTLKASLVWRLAERLLGREAFFEVLRDQYAKAAGDFNGLTLAQAREALNRRGGDAARAILDPQFNEPTSLDLLAGLPQPKGAGWAAALRNAGSFTLNVKVAGVTDKGERLTVDATIPPREFGEAVFATPNKVVRVEIDPEKLYPQTDYANDAAPRSKSPDDAQAEAIAAYNRQEFANAEKAARDALAQNPRLAELRVWLGRALLAQNRDAEADKEFRAALDEKLPSAWVQAWASNGLGDVAARRNQAAEAVKRYTDAVRADAEYAATLAARNARVKADAGATVDESAKAFVAQLDAAIKTGRKQDIEALLVPGELADFAKGLVGGQPEIWQTRVLRTETTDAGHVVADVYLDTKLLGKAQSGTAVYTLARTGGGWKLERVELFEVR